MPPVGLVQHPEHRHLPVLRVRAPADRGVEAAAPEHRLGHRREVEPGPVPLQHREDLAEGRERIAKRLRAHEVEIVGRGMVFREPPIGRARQAAHGQVDPRRAELPLVIAVGREILDPVVAARLQHMRRRAVDQRVAPAALLVMHDPRIAEIDRDEPGLDRGKPGLVEREPCDRADGAGDEDETVGEPGLRGHQPLDELDRDRDPREIVIRKRGVAAMRGDEHFLGALPFDETFAIGQRAGLHLGIDLDLIGAGTHRLEPVPGQAEAPVLLVVAGAVGDPVRMLRLGMEVGAKLVEREGPLERPGVVHDREVMRLEVDDPLAGRVLHEGVVDHPFIRHHPVEDRRARGHFVDFERDFLAEDAERLAHALAGDRAADRIEPGDQRLHRRAGFVGAAAGHGGTGHGAAGHGGAGRRAGGRGMFRARNIPGGVPGRARDGRGFGPGSGGHQSSTSTRGRGTTNLPPHSRTPAMLRMISSLMFQAKMRT